MVHQTTMLNKIKVKRKYLEKFMTTTKIGLACLQFFKKKLTSKSGNQIRNNQQDVDILTNSVLTNSQKTKKSMKKLTKKKRNMGQFCT